MLLYAGNDGALYVIAKGARKSAKGQGNSDVSLMLLIGTPMPRTVTVNELTIVASAFVAWQFISGEFISGNPLGLRIATGNVPNFVETPRPDIGAKFFSIP